MTTDHVEADRREPVLPEAFAALTAAAVRDRRSRRWPRWHGAWVGLAVVLVSGTAVAAATNPWNSVFGPNDRDHASIATSPVPAKQVNTFAVLARPQNAADTSQAVRMVVRRMYSHGFGEKDVHLDGVRLLEQTRTTLTLLVPVGRIGMPTDLKPKVKVAYPERRNQLCLAVASTAPSWSVKRTPSGKSVFVQSTTPAKPIGDPLLTQNDFQVSSTCGSLGDLRRGRLQMSNPSTGDVTGLIPDGVVSVQVTSRRGAIARGTVQNNLFHIRVPQDKPGFRGVPIRGVTANGHLR